MANVFESIARQIAGLVSVRQSQVETSGTVTRIDDEGTVWVRLPGSSEETPCTRRTVKANPGQSVNVRVKDGIASIMGNFSNPATDDSAARRALGSAAAAGEIGVIALGTARDAKGFINTYMAVDEDGFWVGNGYGDFRILEAPGASDGFPEPGIYVVDGNGKIVSKFGEDVRLAPGDMIIAITPDGFFVEFAEHPEMGLVIEKLDDYLGVSDVPYLRWTGPAFLDGNIRFGGNAIFSEDDDATVGIDAQIASSGSMELARRGPVASAKIEAHAMRQASAEARIDLPYGYKPVHDVHTASGIVITTDGVLIIPASLRNGKDFIETIMWCCKNYTGVLD